MRKIVKLREGAERPARQGIAVAAVELRAGGLALLPTETVYGIGVAVRPYLGPRAFEEGLPSARSGYRRIFSLKRRDLAQTVPWLVAGIDDLDTYGRDVPAELRLLAERFWPGALTIVVPASPAVPAFMRAADGTVALRASASPVVQALVRAVGSPLAVTSANTHGMPAPASFADVEPRVLAGVDLAIDAGAAVCREASTIVAFDGGLRVLREGALPSERLLAALKPPHGDGE